MSNTEQNSIIQTDSDKLSLIKSIASSEIQSSFGFVTHARKPLISALQFDMCIVRLCKALSHFAGKQQDILKVVTASFLDGIIQVCYLLQISWVYFFVFKFFTQNRVICEIFHK